MGKIRVYVMNEKNLADYNYTLKKIFYNEYNKFIKYPENGLYPEDVVDWIKKYISSNYPKISLYIVTLSPYLLCALNNMIYVAELGLKEYKSYPAIKWEDIEAYDQYGKSMLDHENRLIIAQKLDQVSEETAVIFDELLDIKYKEE